MADNPNGTVNLSLDALKGLSSTPTAGKSMTREEVRANSQAQSTAARAQQFDNAIRSHRPEPAPQADDQAERPSNASEPEPDAPEEVDTDTPAEPEPDSDDASSPEGGDADSVPETLAEFVEALEIQEDDLKDLKITVKVNGQKQDITLGEAIQNTQFAKANHERAEALTAKERQHEAVAQEQLRQYQELVNRGKVAHVAALQVIQGEFNSPEIQGLRTTDPKQYLEWEALAKHRMAQLNSSFQQLLADEQKNVAARQEELQRAGIARLREAIPDFDTQERFNKIEAVFHKFGATTDDISRIQDDRILLMVSQFADMQAELEELKERDAKSAKKAKQVVKQSKSARAQPQRTQREGSKKRIKAATQNIKGKRGFRARQATQQALLTAIQEGRKRGR
jgi:hypothetical protein